MFVKSEKKWENEENWIDCVMRIFEEFTFRHAWTEEEEWARPDTSDLVNFIIIIVNIIVSIVVTILNIHMIMISKLILILFRSGCDQSPPTLLRGTGT